MYIKEISAVTAFISVETLECISVKNRPSTYNVTAEYHSKPVTCLEAEGQKSICMAGCEEYAMLLSDSMIPAL